MKSRIALLIAIVLGFVAAWAVRQYVRQEKTAIYGRNAPAPVVVAAREIRANEAITGASVEAKSYPIDFVPERSITWMDVTNAIGEKVNRTIKRGEAILWSDIIEGEKEKQRGLQGLLAPGERASTISVTPISGVGGHIRPGDRVDVYAVVERFRPLAGEPQVGPSAFDLREVDREIDDAERALARAQSANDKPLANEMRRRLQTLQSRRATVLRSWHLEGETVTFRILRSVEVLATDERMDVRDPAERTRRGTGKKGYSSVTLKLTPLEAGLLISAASNKATFSTALRNREDILDVETVDPISEEKFWEAQQQAEQARNAVLQKLVETGEEDEDTLSP